MLRALTVAVVLVLAGCGGGVAPPKLVENRAAGFTLLLPHGWRVSIGAPLGPRSVMLSTYALARRGDMTEKPPDGATWIALFDYGPLRTEPAESFPPIAARLPPQAGIEGVGTGRNLSFRAVGHAFQAIIKGDPDPATTLGILRSIRVTPVHH